MAATVEAEIKGLKELQKKMEQIVKDLHGAPMLNAMRDSTLTIQRYAKQNAPVDTGRLRASIIPEVTSEVEALMGVVGSNVVYAPYVEYGTRPHFPPVGALDVWADRHGVNAFLIARAIFRRGTRAHPFLVPAFEKAQPAIIRRFEKATAEVVNK